MAKTHRIAVVPGDGIGKETVPEALKVLDAASRRFGFALECRLHGICRTDPRPAWTPGRVARLPLRKRPPPLFLLFFHQIISCH